MEHSRQWWLHIGGSKVFEPLFRAEMSFLNHFFAKFSCLIYQNWNSGVIFFDGVQRRWLRGHFCSRFYACSPYRGWTPKWGAACSSYRGWTSKWGAACSPYRGWTLKWGAACSPLRGWDCRPAETAVFSRFWTFLDAFCLHLTNLYGQTMYILQRNRLQMSFPGRREAPNILLPPLEGSHRLLNWQIQVKRVSWVGQSTTSRRTHWGRR